VVDRLAQARQHLDHRGADGTDGAICVAADANGLFGAHVGLGAVFEGVMALPEALQLLLERGVDLLPDRDDLETHRDGPPVAARVAGCGDIWRTITRYSSNCNLPSLLVSKRDSGGALSPARRTRIRLLYSVASSTPSLLASTRSNCVRRRLIANCSLRACQPLRNSSRDSTPLPSASQRLKTASAGCGSART